jgi:hypothetical protein
MAEVHHLAEVALEHDHDAFANVVCLHFDPFRMLPVSVCSHRGDRPAAEPANGNVQLGINSRAEENGT